MSQLKIPADIFKQMLDQANAEVPIEACGILAGKNNVVEKYYEMENLDKSPVHFTMEPKEQFAVIKNLRASGLEMLAICHSHPATPARLSEEDKRLALTPGTAYAILSLQDADNPVIKSFKVDNGNVIEVPVEITE